MATRIESWFNQELTEPVKVRYLDGNVFSADNAGNLIGVNVFNNGSPASIAGSVSANVIRADGATVAVSGALSGNKATVVLNQSCYAVPGPISIIIKLTTGGAITTLCAVVANVYQSSTDTVIDPGTIIPSVQTLIAEIEAAVASIPADYSDLWECLAPAFSTSKAYSAGDYVTYNGGLYRFVTDHAAGSWVSTQVTKTSLGRNISHNNGYCETISYQYGLFDSSLLVNSFSKRFVPYMVPCAVYNYGEGFVDSSRASCLIDESIIDGDIYIYNPSKKSIGVYYRRKSDNYYIGYAQAFTNALFFSITPDSDYKYYIIAKTSDDSNWVLSGLNELNKNVFIYSGSHLTKNELLEYSKRTNLITESIIHIGKYYSELGLQDNANMAYTDLIPVEPFGVYYFPFITLGYAWYDADRAFISGAYSSEDSTNFILPYKTLTAPAGAYYIGVSARSGDVPNMRLSKIIDSMATVPLACDYPVLQSKVIRDPVNWLYNLDFKQNYQSSRIKLQNGATLNGVCAVLPAPGNIFSIDHVTMDKSKTSIFFAVPSGTPEFVCGNNSYYTTGGGLIDSNACIAVLFKSNGTTAEVRKGSGNSGDYDTLLATMDVSSLGIQSGKQFVVSIEKDSINKYIVSVYDALSPSDVISATIEAEQAGGDPDYYTNQIRGWGGPFAKCISGTINVYRIQMYSTAPSCPRVAVWGDSYIENYSRAPGCSYANLIRTALDGNAFLSGRGGATAGQGSRRMAIEINTCAPQYIILNFGVNDSFSVSVSDFKSNLNADINMVKAKGAEPILITVPRINDGTHDNSTWIQSVNPWVRDSGYRYIDIAYALSTGDGITQDLTKFVGDKTHPNLSGGQAIFNYIKAFLPDLLWR